MKKIMTMINILSIFTLIWAGWSIVKIIAALGGLWTTAAILMAIFCIILIAIVIYSVVDGIRFKK